jgi:hypothetical protein
MKGPSIIQFGEAPATIAKTDEIMREKLKANLRPTTSAERPQKRAPINMPT